MDKSPVKPLREYDARDKPSAVFARSGTRGNAMRLWAGLCLSLAACGPVVLHGDAGPAGSTDTTLGPGAADAAVVEANAEDGSVPSILTAGDASRIPLPMSQVSAQVTVGPSGCGGCFGLLVLGLGGTPPYQVRWSDGATVAQRSLCISEATRLSVVVTDAAGATSAPYGVDLQPTTVGCNVVTPMLCLSNPSFEAIATGGTPPLEVEEWSDCTDDADSNTPDIGSADASPSAIVSPAPTDGSYYLGLSEGEQVSQRTCGAAIQPGETRHFEVDLMRVPRTQLAPGSATQSVFLEVWGGVAAACSQRQLLWASPSLTPSWERYCVEITSLDFIDQVTLRASSDMTSRELGYVAVDNLTPVDGCSAR